MTSAISREQLEEGARRILLSNLREGVADWNGREFSFVCPSLTGYPFQWFWDSCFHALALLHLDPEQAKKEMRSLMSGAQPSGFIPHIIFWEMEKQPDFLSRNIVGMTEPNLQRHHPAAHHRLRRGAGVPRDRRRGVPAGSPAHPDPLLPLPARGPRPRQRRPHRRHPARGGRHRLLAQVRRNPGPWRNCRTGASSPRCGRYTKPTNPCATTTTPSWPPTYSTSRTCWSTPSTASACAPWPGSTPRSEGRTRPRPPSSAARPTGCGMRWWRSAGTRRPAPSSTCRAVDEKPLKTVTISSLMPLILADLPRHQVETLVERWVRPPEHFWTPYPLPSVPASDPKFMPGNPGGFIWRGPSWINTNYFLSHSLRGHGYPELSEPLVEKSKECIAKSGFREYYHPLHRRGD